MTKTFATVTLPIEKNAVFDIAQEVIDYMEEIPGLRRLCTLLDSAVLLIEQTKDQFRAPSPALLKLAKAEGYALSAN